MAQWNNDELIVLEAHLKQTDLDINQRLELTAQELHRPFLSVRSKYYRLREHYKLSHNLTAPRYTKYNIV